MPEVTRIAGFSVPSAFGWRRCIVGLRIAQRLDVHGARGGDLGGGAVADEERHAADQHADLAAFRNLGDVDFGARQRARVSGGSELLDERPGDRGDAAGGDGRSGDMDEIASGFSGMSDIRGSRIRTVFRHTSLP